LITVLAASTQRNVGAVIAALAIGGFLVYWFFNWLQGRGETGAELELASNRKPYMSDDELETKKLDVSLAAGLACLAVIGISLPLYWLGEPGRHEGREELNDTISESRGEELYAANCAQCHGTVDGAGGLVDFVLVDDNGLFVENVQWKAPALNTLMYRFSKDEVTYVLNFGRQNSPMPAWGAPGGGPLTSQQVEEVIDYITLEQVPLAELREKVEAGLDDTARVLVLRANPDLEGDEAAIDAAVAQMLAAAEDDPTVLGELLFNNEADAGVYGCARCHTAGWSYDATDLSVDNPLVAPEVPGGGGFGPSLVGGATLRQFDTAEEQAGFIEVGVIEGQAYGNFGQGDGGGQMPAFGLCVGDRISDERDIIVRNDFCETVLIEGEEDMTPEEFDAAVEAALAEHGGSGILTTEQIAAIVAYERGL
jgi:mono/diheme cytochrome c family protein